MASSLIQDLLDCPETVTVTLAGRERPFLLSVYGAELASAAGHDPIPPLADALSGLFTSGAAGVDLESVRADPGSAASAIAASASAVSTKTLSAVAVAIWAGLLPFDRELELDYVKAVLTPGTLGAVLRVALVPMIRLAMGSTDEDAQPEGSTSTEDAPKVSPGKPSP